uniref:Uncharacterized protein n=1 Tax=Hyaloperonospora arabidopsidis (strain Emoy2) TaxID=559515 RepID=M4BWN6_HYAAE
MAALLKVLRTSVMTRPRPHPLHLLKIQSITCTCSLHVINEAAHSYAQSAWKSGDWTDPSWKKGHTNVLQLTVRSLRSNA